MVSYVDSIVVDPASVDGSGKPFGDGLDAYDLFAISEDDAHTRESFGGFRVKAAEKGALAMGGKGAEGMGPFRFGH